MMRSALVVEGNRNEPVSVIIPVYKHVAISLLILSTSSKHFNKIVYHFTC